MKWMLCPDSFKGSLSAEQAAQAMAEGIRRAEPEAEIVRFPIADGGEGTMQVLRRAGGGQEVRRQVTGPYGESVTASYLRVGKRAIVELAQASGLLVTERREPILSTTYGTGMLLRDALLHGAEEVCLTLGGSATNDGGAGIAAALGVRFLDADGGELPPTCEGLSRLARIDASGMLPQARTCRFLIACDVKNPLCGPEGASAVYGPQKGADAPMIARMDAVLEHYARLLEWQTGRELLSLPGGGAAGGAAIPLLAFAQVTLCAGIDLVLDALDFDTAAAGAACILTGEGRIDAQTKFGKAIAGVAARAEKLGIPVAVFAGKVSLSPAECPPGMRVYGINPPGGTLAEQMAHAYENLREAVYRAAKEGELCQRY